MPIGPLLSVKFPATSPPHLATIPDRERNSGLTSVRFLGQDLLACADFNEKMLYLTRYGNGEWKILDRHPTVDAAGNAVETDLMDCLGDTIAVTNFYQGSISLYATGGGRIRFLKEYCPGTLDRAHGVRFMPGHPDLAWLSYCGSKDKCSLIVDWRNERVLHEVRMQEMAQDVAFLHGYALQVARTNHIRRKPDPAKPLPRMYSTLYLYRIPADPRSEPPQLVDEWHGDGHLDAAKEHDGRVYAANQYNDTVDVFEVHRGKIYLMERMKGFGMPHGLDVRADGLLAVTNYEDQSLRMGRLAHA